MTTETKHVLIELLKNTENGMDEFRRWLDMELHRQIVTVVFTKKDGTERTMRCTLNHLEMPPQEVPAPPELPADGKLLETTLRAARKYNPDVRTCYDMDGGAWKSFRWDSVKSVTYSTTITE
jgi:hypothetical protein